MAAAQCRIIQIEVKSFTLSSHKPIINDPLSHHHIRKIKAPSSGNKDGLLVPDVHTKLVLISYLSLQENN